MFPLPDLVGHVCVKKGGPPTFGVIVIRQTDMVGEPSIRRTDIVGKLTIRQTDITRTDMVGEPSIRRTDIR